MYSVIDRLDTLTGWSGPGLVLNQIENYIAHDNTASVLLNTTNGSVHEKTLVIDPTGYEYLSLSIQSNKLGKNEYFSPNDFLHKISFGTTVYYLPAFPTMRQAVFKIQPGETLNKIRIESLGVDSIFISHLQLLNENHVSDMLNSIKDSIEIYEKQIGTITVSAGSKTIDVSLLEYIQKSNRIRIANEYHVIDDIDGYLARFTSDYDGKTIQSNYTNEPIFISCSIEIGGDSNNLIAPGIWIWSGDSRQVSKETYYELENYVIGTPDQVDVRYMSGTYTTPVQIQIISAYKLFMDSMDQKVKKFLENNRVWINNNPLNYEIINVSSIQDGDYLKKIYEIVFEHGEKIWQNQTQKFPLSGTTNLTLTVR